MARRRARDLTVGTVFALALVILALAVMAVGGESGLFFDKASYYSVFPAADGLLVGAPVRMNGVGVGTVTGIQLPTNPASTGIKVQFGIDTAYAERVRHDSRAALRILQLLTNEKFIEISPGSLDSPLLETGSELPRLVETGVLQQGEAIAENLGEITVSLRKILGPMERGEGMIGQMLQDPQFGREGLESLGKALENLETVAADLAAGKGVAGRLLGDDELASSLDDMAGAVESFTRVMAAVERGDGAVGEILEEGGTAQLAIADLQESAASLRRLTQQFESGEGFLGKLLYDSDYSEELAADLALALDNVAEITEKINRGDGTLGALINDRTLHDGAEDLVAGTNDSKFARWLLRHYRKKGVKAQEKAEEKAEEEAEGP